MKTIVFFNNKGGVGKTSLVYHLAWMINRLGHSVLAVDLDPQSNLTSAFLDEEELEGLWKTNPHQQTILGALAPLIESLGDLAPLEARQINPGLFLLPGDLGLSTFEDRLSEAWSKCIDDNRATAADGFRVMTAFYRMIDRAAAERNVEIALIDVGPNVGSMNRAALVASDYVVIPLEDDLFSIQCLSNLGPTLRTWRMGWQDRKSRDTIPAGLVRAEGAMSPMGYVLLSPVVRANRPGKAYAKWAIRIPHEYATSVLGEPPGGLDVDADPHRLAMIKQFKSLVPMAQDARKPMFMLTPADGAIGGHSAAVSACYDQFERLAISILQKAGLT